MTSTPISTTKPLVDLVSEIVSIPTASFVEQHVSAYIRQFANDRGLNVSEDRYGNLYVEYRRGRATRPLVIGAHTDHPGFVVESVRGRRLQLEFRGGLSAEYGKGECLRVYSVADGEESGLARITSVRKSPTGRILGARATLFGRGTKANAGDLALWDVPTYRLRRNIVQARQCDDLIGCTAVLATLDRVSASRSNGRLIGLFTRAEEVGLCGASVAARDHLLPEDSLVVALETSSMTEGRAQQGAGPIIRVGDAIHIFSPLITQWMTKLAQELSTEDSAFRYQRKLMDGGVTEATSYALYGYETGAACIALGNYHNAGKNGKVAAETVHIEDLEGLVRLLERMLKAVPRFERSLPELLRTYDRLGRDAAPDLVKTARSTV